MAFTMSIPSRTLPKTTYASVSSKSRYFVTIQLTCLPSNQLVIAVVIKNCEPVFQSAGDAYTWTKARTIGILSSVGHREHTGFSVTELAVESISICFDYKEQITLEFSSL